LLPEAATRRDLDDQGTIAAIATTVETPERLRLLAALSEADSRATGPAAWGSWRRDLFELLVRRVAETLDGQDLLAVTPVRSPTPQQLELLRQPGRVVRAGHNVVTVIADDRPGLFSRVAGVLAANGLDVLAASAHSSEDGRALSEFRVVDSTGRDTPWQRVVSDLEQALDGRLAVNARIADRARLYGRNRPAYARLASSSVSFDNDVSPNATVIDVHAPDRIGLLYWITRTMAELDLDIRSAKVETFGAQAVDSFYVRDLKGAKILDTEGLVEIERAILHSLGDGLG
jgi:[protein-PII] uridylyltransferase